jgi:hypothetical protein
MADGVLIVGPSGSGKSTSLEKLDPKSTFIINVKNKPLPFRGWKNNYTVLSKENPNGNYIGTDNPQAILGTMQHVSDKMPHIKVLIVEDFQYMAANEFMQKATEVGFAKFTSIGKNIYSVADLHNKLRNDLTVIYINHDDESTDAMGDRKVRAKTAGKLIDNVVTLEGLFTVVLFTKVKKGKEGMEYFFVTQTDGATTAKSPRGMFEALEIPNDLAYVVNQMNEYNK